MSHWRKISRIDLVQPQNKRRLYLPERLMPSRAQENALCRTLASAFVVESREEGGPGFSTETASKNVNYRIVHKAGCP